MKHWILMTAKCVTVAGVGAAAVLAKPLFKKAVNWPTQEQFASAALATGDFATFRQTIEGGLSVDFRSDCDATPLMDAAFSNNVSLAEWLIAHGADVNAKDLKGNTPLIHAATADAVEVIQALLAAGADRSHRNRMGNTALAAASNAESRRAERMLRDSGDPTPGPIRTAP